MKLNWLQVAFKVVELLLKFGPELYALACRIYEAIEAMAKKSPMTSEEKKVEFKVAVASRSGADLADNEIDELKAYGP
jgi:hypothetical protein